MVSGKQPEGVGLEAGSATLACAARTPHRLRDCHALSNFLRKGRGQQENNYISTLSYLIIYFVLGN